MQYFNQKPIRLIELFAGIGSQAKALKNLDVDFEHWRVCEFDPHAIRSYNAVHGTNFTTSDITKISAGDLNITDTDRFTYLLTYSFPCQDLSNAGKGAGMEKGSGTRSGLLWEVERLLNECDELPQVLLMENVPQVHGKKNMVHFEKWIEFLESKGYSNYWQDLNAKDYGMPQNRNRCYMVSILGEYSYKFPTPVPLTLKLGDMLENEVDEKYYLSDRHLQKISQWKAQQKPLSRVLGHNSVSPTLTARGAGEYHSGMVLFSDDLKETTNLEEQVKQQSSIIPAPTSEMKRKLCNELLENNLVEEHDVIRHSYTKNRLNNGIENMARTESKEKLSPTLDTRCDCLGVVVKEPTELQKEVCDKAIEKHLMKPYDIIDYTYSNARLKEIENEKLQIKNSTDNQVSCTLTTQPNNFAICVPGEINVVGNYSPSGHEASRIVHPDGVAPTVKENHGTVTATLVPPLQVRELTSAEKEKYGVDTATSVSSSRIRKFTPKECWRLMGFDDVDVENAAKTCSNSQLYKQAGNSIVVNVLMAIFKELFIPTQTRSQWLDELLNN